MKTILITGGCGFIASHLVEHIYRNTDWKILIIDKLSYASNGLERLRDAELLENSRVKIFTCDLTNNISVGMEKEFGTVNYIIHMAAETHVDNSILYPKDCIHNNVMSTVNILEYARRQIINLEKFFYFSTDEVYGPAPNNIRYKETDRHKPTNPYSASKSAGEQICVAYENTYKIPLLIVNVMNAFGESQHVEKFIPKCIKYIKEDKVVQIHSDTECVNSGSRFYIHAINISDAVLFLLEKGIVGESYHISGEREMTNLELAKFIANILGKELKYEMVNWHSNRPGHDLRYALDDEKIRKLGWKLPMNFEHSLQKTIEWTLKNPKWLEE